MFIKQRVRKSSRFQSRWSRASSRRREHMASLYAGAVIQFFLCLFLLVCSYRSLVLMRLKFPDVIWYWKYALPFVLLVGAALVARHLFDNVAYSIELYRSRGDRPAS